MSQGVASSCLTCGGLIPEPGISYGYGGKICHCPIDPLKVRYQRRADEQQLGGLNQFNTLALSNNKLYDIGYVEGLQKRVKELQEELLDTKSILEAVEEQTKKNSEYDDFRVSLKDKRIEELEVKLASIFCAATDGKWSKENDVDSMVACVREEIENQINKALEYKDL